MKDITNPVGVEVEIRDDGKVLWVNTENGCVLRICGIKDLKVEHGNKVYYRKIAE
jgi:hypothetical protein